jgi:hypothetical protein
MSLFTCARRALRCTRSGEVPYVRHFKWHTWLLPHASGVTFTPWPLYCTFSVISILTCILLPAGERISAHPVLCTLSHLLSRPILAAAGNPLFVLFAKEGADIWPWSRFDILVTFTVLRCDAVHSCRSIYPVSEEPIARTIYPDDGGIMFLRSVEKCVLRHSFLSFKRRYIPLNIGSISWPSVAGMGPAVRLHSVSDTWPYSLTCSALALLWWHIQWTTVWFVSTRLFGWIGCQEE